uniref:Uncharacterized protein n=1 Tax=Anopheles culicifacies TaxID=139723 RepID=A0A182LRK0_9DIPT
MIHPSVLMWRSVQAEVDDCRTITASAFFPAPGYGAVARISVRRLGLQKRLHRKGDQSLFATLKDNQHAGTFAELRITRLRSDRLHLFECSCRRNLLELDLRDGL